MSQVAVDSMNSLRVERETHRAQANRDELIERIARAVPRDGGAEPLKGLFLYRISSTTELFHGVSVPALCVIAQGSKDVFLGDERYRYDPMHYLLTTAELPIVTCLLEASPERPYLGLSVRLDTILAS